MLYLWRGFSFRRREREMGEAGGWKKERILTTGCPEPIARDRVDIQLKRECWSQGSPCLWQPHPLTQLACPIRAGFKTLCLPLPAARNQASALPVNRGMCNM